MNDLHVLTNYFYDKRNGVVVECGTAEGNHMPSSYMEKELGWKFIGFEVDPRFWPVLLQNRPNGLNINAALSDENGFASFTVSAWGGNSSLNMSAEHAAELISYRRTFENGSFFQNVTVPCMTWKNFIKSYKIENVDFLILDVEGCEMKVLNGMIGSEVMPDVIQIEFGYSDPTNKLRDEKTKEDFSGFIILKHKLQEMGYRFDYVQYNNAYFSKNDFWKDKQLPDKWEEESNEFTWFGYCRYNKDKCKNL
jgi:FkbM family methyltransferase